LERRRIPTDEEFSIVPRCEWATTTGEYRILSPVRVPYPSYWKYAAAKSEAIDLKAGTLLT
jgi:hypothetical protein